MMTTATINANKFHPILKSFPGPSSVLRREPGGAGASAPKPT